MSDCGCDANCKHCRAQREEVQLAEDMKTWRSNKRAEGERDKREPPRWLRRMPRKKGVASA